MTLREEIMKQSVLNEDKYYTRNEVVEAVDDFAKSILDVIRSRMHDVYESINKEGATPENKEKGKNILTMLKSTEKMIGDVWGDYRARI